MKASVNKILKSDLTKNYGFPVTYVDEDQVTHSFNVFTNDQFRQIVKQMFGERTYNDWDDESVIASLVADFQASFDAWKAIRQDTYGRRMFALSVKFNPLENYRSHEEREGSFEHGRTETLSFTGRKEKTTDDTYLERTHTNLKETTTDDTYVERTHTNLKETTKDDSYIERTHTNLKETTTDDTYVERTHTNLKETTTDDSFIERSYDDYVETTKDDSYVEHSNTNYKETTKDDSYVEHSWGNNYEETYGHGQQVHRHEISADDATTYVAGSQDTDLTYDDTKSITGTTKDQHGYTSNGITKEISGSTKDQNGCTDGKTIEQAGSYKDQHGQTLNGHVVETTGSYKDQHGQTLNGHVVETTGSYKDQHGQTLNGHVVETTGSYKDQHGFTDGIIKETSGSYRDTHGYTDGLIREQFGTETRANSGTDLDGYSLDRYGNIGVTTSQQMLASDLDLLKYDISMMAIKEFISQYTYFSYEVE